MFNFEEQLIRFVEMCFIKKSNCLNQIHQIIENLPREPLSHITNIFDQLTLPMELRHPCFELLKQAKAEKINPSEFLIAINVSKKMYERRTDSFPIVHPIWTGPNFEESPIRHRTYESEH